MVNRQLKILLQIPSFSAKLGCDWFNWSVGGVFPPQSTLLLVWSVFSLSSEAESGSVFPLFWSAFFSSFSSDLFLFLGGFLTWLLNSIVRISLCVSISQSFVSSVWVASLDLPFSSFYCSIPVSSLYHWASLLLLHSLPHSSFPSSLSILGEDSDCILILSSVLLGSKNESFLFILQ